MLGAAFVATGVVLAQTGRAAATEAVVAREA
jgi:hypothetical protein